MEVINMIILTPAIAGDQQKLYEFNELKPEIQDIAVRLYRKSLIDKEQFVDRDTLELQLKDDKEVREIIESNEPLFTEYGTVTEYTMDIIREAKDGELEVVVYWAAECRVKVDQELADLTEEEFNYAFPGASISYDAFRVYVDNAEYIDLIDLEDYDVVVDYIKSGENLMQFYYNDNNEYIHVDTDLYFECSSEMGQNIEWDDLDTGWQEVFTDHIVNGNFSGSFYAYDKVEIVEKEITLEEKVKAAKEKFSQRDTKNNDVPNGRDER